MPRAPNVLDDFNEILKKKHTHTVEIELAYVFSIDKNTAAACKSSAVVDTVNM